MAFQNDATQNSPPINSPPPSSPPQVSSFLSQLSVLSAQASAASAAAAAATAPSSLLVLTTSDSSSLTSSADAFTTAVAITSPTTLSTSIALASSTSSTDTAPISQASVLAESSDSTSVSHASTIPSMTLATASPVTSSSATSIWPTAAPEHSPTFGPGIGGYQGPPPGGSPPPGPPPHEHGLSRAALAAAAVVPVTVLALFFLVSFLCMRRRRKQRGEDFRPVAEMKDRLFLKHAAGFASGGFAVTEASAQPHMLLSPENTSYNTGLDDAASGHFIVPFAVRKRTEEPPPPYRPRSETNAASVADTASTMSTIARPQAAMLYAQHNVPLLLTGLPRPMESSPFSDSFESLEPPVANGFGRPAISRHASARSMTSTLYSSDASIREARPARRSVSSAHVIRSSLTGLEKSPFADPDPDDDDS